MATGGIGQATLNWLPSFGATFYNVYRATSPGGQGAVPLVSGLTSPTYVDNSVTNGVTYYYFSDGNEFRFRRAIYAAAQLRPYCRTATASPAVMPEDPAS